jgi:hypothetical protein
MDTELATIRFLPEESDFTFTTKQLEEEEAAKRAWIKNRATHKR